MQVKTWLHRLTDESNLWFNAIKAEDEGEPLEAARYYLKDATQWLKNQGSLVRAALSCSCAANCLAQIGNNTHSRRLYLQSAAMYIENADTVIGQSIREALWSLQEAYENLVMCGDEENAMIIYDRYVSLATKISPFAGAEEAMKVLGFRKFTSQAAQRNVRTAASSIQQPAQQIPEEITAEIEQFLKNTKSTIPKPGIEPSPEMVLASIDTSGNRGVKISEKSIVS